MADTPRRFTLEEANALIPSLEASLRRMDELRQEIGARANEIERFGYGPLGNASAPPPEVVERKKRLEEAKKRLDLEVDQLSNEGALLGDVDRGIVELLSTLDGRDVLLSWQLGEPQIRYYRPLDHAARRPLP